MFYFRENCNIALNTLSWQNHFKIKKKTKAKMNKTEFILICIIESNLEINY